MNPLPSNATRTGPDPAWTLLGWMELIAGANVAAASEGAGRTNVKYSG